MNKPEYSTLLNVCVFPDERVSTECVNISQSFKSEDTMFVLGNGLFPHMTVYMARFADDDIDKVADATEEALKQAAVFRCTHTGYFMTEGRYLEASYRKSAEFLNLTNYSLLIMLHYESILVRRSMKDILHHTTPSSSRTPKKQVTT